jgi:hypothetical protein
LEAAALPRPVAARLPPQRICPCCRTAFTRRLNMAPRPIRLRSDCLQSIRVGLGLSDPVERLASCPYVGDKWDPQAPLDH